MTKTIIHDKQMLILVLVVAFYVGASITGVFFDFDAEAKKTQGPIFLVGGENIIKMNKGTATCTNQGESCEVKKVMAKFRLLTTEVDENGNASGVASGEIRILPDIDEQRLTLTNDGSFSYANDANNRIITMSGIFIDPNNNIYEYDAVGNIAEPTNNKANIDLIMQLVGDNGIVIDVSSAGTVRVS